MGVTATRVVLRVREDEEEEEEEEEEEIVEEEEGGRELEVSLTVEVLMVLRQRERETERGGEDSKRCEVWADSGRSGPKLGQSNFDP